MITNNEYEILNLMWTQNRPLARSEIIQLLPEKSWSSSSIHILLNKLIEKKAIQVEGFIRTGKNYGRTYTPLLTRDEYVVSRLKNKPDSGNGFMMELTQIFNALLQDEGITSEILEEMESMLMEKKAQLNT